MKNLTGSLYIASLLAGLAGVWFSVMPTLVYLIDRFDGDFAYRPFESFLYREGILLLVSLGVLMLAHIGTNVVGVFDEGTQKKEDKELNNLSGTPWDPDRKEKPDG